MQPIDPHSSSDLRPSAKQTSCNGSSRSNPMAARFRSNILVAGFALLAAAAFLPWMTACNGGGPMPFVTALSCTPSSITGSGQVTCSVKLNARAGGGGQGVSVISSSSAVVVPISLIVPGNATTATFTGTVSPVPTVQTVNVTAASGGFSQSVAITLGSAVPTLSVNPTTVAFGNVMENSTVTQTVTLASTGQLPLTVTGATATGVGYSVSGQTFPFTINPNQTATLTVGFDPTTVGAIQGNVIVASNSSAGNDTVVALTGAGLPAIGVTVGPAAISMYTGQEFQFESAVTGTSNPAVSWSVSGTGCTGSACGTIDANGVYTAPATLPTPATVVVTATSQETATATGSDAVSLVQSLGKVYYIAPDSTIGADSNDGLTLATPWASPDHAVNCGDVLIAAASSAYQYWEFNSGMWGKVSCPAGSGVAWLQCATFDGCQITSGGGILVDQSYWGVSGWEVTATLPYSGCFAATPNSTNPVEVHHIIFANDVANGCISGGFIAYNNWTNLAASVDYLSIVGDIAYNAAQGNTNCYSGISVYEPIQYDSQPGTHIYVAGNFSYANEQPNPCGGYPAPGADGIIFDTFDGSQAGFATPYSAQAVAENNIAVGNNGRGIEVQNNVAGSTHAPVFVQDNTSWGNDAATGVSAALCAELDINAGYSINMNHNLAVTDESTACGGYTLNGIQAYNGDSTDTVDTNFVYSASGNNFYTWPTGAVNFGADNITGESPNFANAAVPDAPSCGGTANAPACMAPVIADFVPGNSAAAGFGYQVPSSTPVTDSLFPQWLCNVNLPSGLVSMGCK